MSTGQADSAPSVDNQPDAFDEAMAELTGEGSAPTDDVAGKQPEAQGEPPIDDQASPPAAPAGGTEPPAGNAAPDGEPTDDVWKDVPEAARTAWDQAQATIASLRGRASAEARRANEFQRQLSQRSVGSIEEHGDDGEKVDSTPLSPAAAKLKRLMEDYPEIGDPITELRNELKQEIAGLRAPVHAFEQTQEAENAQAMLEAVAAKNPRWNAYHGDPRWDEFRATQPRFVTDAMGRNWSSISDPDEAAFVVERFEQFIGGPAATPTPMPAPTPTPSADPRRQRQLDAGRDAGSTGAGATPTGIPADDFDAAVGIFADRADRHLASSKR